MTLAAKRLAIVAALVVAWSVAAYRIAPVNTEIVVDVMQYGMRLWFSVPAASVWNLFRIRTVFSCGSIFTTARIIQFNQGDIATAN